MAKQVVLNLQEVSILINMVRKERVIVETTPYNRRMTPSEKAAWITELTVIERKLLN